jgi:hypothetical protein
MIRPLPEILEDNAFGHVVGPGRTSTQHLDSGLVVQAHICQQSYNRVYLRSCLRDEKTNKHENVVGIPNV